MTGEDAQEGPEERAAAEAADWFLRLQDERAGAETWAAFQAWLSDSPDNSSAYGRIEALWEELDLRRDAIRRRLDAAEASFASAAPSPRRAPRPEPSALRRRTWLIGAGAVAASLLAAVVVVGGRVAGQPGSSAAAYRTANGETRELNLADGTKVHLNGGSSITVSLDRDARRVTVSDAEAAFEVAHDPARPFLVAVGDRTVRVVGTEFNLRRREGKLVVTVRRGVVDVAGSSPQAQRTRLVRGEQLTHRQGEATSVVRDVDAEAAFAWRLGQVIYDRQPLADVAVDLSRRFAVPVRTADARTAGLTFSGVLVLDDQEAVLRRLQAFLPVTSERSEGEILLRAR